MTPKERKALQASKEKAIADQKSKPQSIAPRQGNGVSRTRPVGEIQVNRAIRKETYTGPVERKINVPGCNMNF